MSTLKVNKLRDTAGSADAITLDPNGGAVLAGVTTVTSVKVGAAVTISESGIEASGIGITCANINGAQIGGRRNIMINGAMNVAQRYTSGTSTGTFMADRYKANFANINVTVTGSQQSLTSSDTPYSLGFRKFGRIALASAATAGSDDYIEVLHKFEGQDINLSGWDYTSSSSNITISFWFRCSTNQTFYADLRSRDGTSYIYSFSFTATGNNTWTKITKTISGNSNVQIDNDTGNGLDFRIRVYFGSDNTDSITLNQWRTYSNSSQTPNMDSTWITAGASTFDVTGFQLEAGSQATAFEHRSYADELRRCQRYYYRANQGSDSGERPIALGTYETSSAVTTTIRFPDMRTSPSIDVTDSSNAFMIRRENASDSFDTFTLRYSRVNSAEIVASSGVSGTAGVSGMVRSSGASTHLSFSAEF